MRNTLLLPALLGAASVSARDIPSNIKSFYDGLKTKGTCSKKLATGFYAKDDGPNSEFGVLELSNKFGFSDISTSLLVLR